MKQVIIGLAACIAAAAAQAKTSTPAGWTDDYDAALKRAAAEKKLVLADFSGSDWCGWCKIGGSKIDVYGVRYRQVPPNAGLEEFVR